MKGQEKPAVVLRRSVIARMMLTTRRYFGIGGVGLDSEAVDQFVPPRLGRASVQRGGASGVTGTRLALERPDRFECLVQASADFGAAAPDAGWRVQRTRVGSGPPASVINGRGSRGVSAAPNRRSV